MVNIEKQQHSAKSEITLASTGRNLYLASNTSGPTKEQLEKLTDYIKNCLGGKIPLITHGEEYPLSWSINGGSASIHSGEHGMHFSITKNGKTDFYFICPDLDEEGGKFRIINVNGRTKISRADYENVLFALKQCPFRS